MSKAKYELIEGDHGMGGMGDYRSKVIAYFTTIGKAYEFFQKHDITVNYKNEAISFDIDKTMCVKDKNSGMGHKDYCIKEITKPKIVVDPEDL
jgi:hypothetical protein